MSSICWRSFSSSYWMNQPIICRHRRFRQLGRQSSFSPHGSAPVDHLLDAPRHARLGRRLLELPGAIDIGEALADQIDQRRDRYGRSRPSPLPCSAQSLALRGAMASDPQADASEITASASISTSQSGLMNPVTCSMLEAGADVAEELAMHAGPPPPNGRCRPDRSGCGITSLRLAPASSSALAMISRMARVCAAGSPIADRLAARAGGGAADRDDRCRSAPPGRSR